MRDLLKNAPELYEFLLQNVKVCARLTRRRSCDVVWNQMLVRSGYQVAHLCARKPYIEHATCEPVLDYSGKLRPGYWHCPPAVTGSQVKSNGRESGGCNQTGF